MRRPFLPRLETLESRLTPTIANPLQIGGATGATYTDSNGDEVTVLIEGSAGTVNFFDAGNNQVDDGDDIARVVITGASSDFVLTFSDSTGGGDDIFLGDITSNRVIRGIQTNRDAGNNSVFSLGSFRGVNFSAGGGLDVDTVTGDGNDLGLLLTGGLARNASVKIRGQLAADLVFGDSRSDKIDGQLNIGGDTTGTGNVAFAGTVGEMFVMQVDSTFNGNVQAAGAFNGKVYMEGPSASDWNFNGGVGAKAVLNADEWDNVFVIGDFAGALASVFNEATLTVSRDLTSTARIAGASTVTLNVGRDARAGASVVSDFGITFTVGRTMSGDFMAGGASISGTVTGEVKNARLVSEGNFRLNVAMGVAGTTIAADNQLTLNVAANVVGSNISSGLGQMTMAINGDVTKSRFSGDITSSIVQGSVKDSFFRATSSDDIFLTIGRDLVNTRMETADVISLNVAGSVLNSRLIASTGGVTLATGLDLRNSTLIAADDDIQLNVGRDALGNQFQSDDQNNTWMIGRNFQGQVISASNQLTLTVGGSVLAGSLFQGGDDIVFNVTGNFDAEVEVERLEFVVGGNVGAKTRINVNEVLDLAFDSVGFRVGGNFAGVLIADAFDANSDATAGQTHTLVGGMVAATAEFNVLDFSSTSDDDDYRFAGDFLGKLNIGGDLDVGLRFGGNANTILVGGLVNDTIAVLGRLNFLRSNSRFLATTPGMDGDFLDGLDNITGTLDTGAGFKTVTPLAQGIVI